MITVTLYGKPGCCLCDDARAVIAEVARARTFALREVDVSVDPVLHRRYGERIPVVEVDGEEAFEAAVDARGLIERIDTVER